jgi:uncharacterized membrane protein
VFLLKSLPCSLIFAFLTIILAILGIKEVLTSGVNSVTISGLLIGALVTALLFWGSISSKYTERLDKDKGVTSKPASTG